MTKRVVVRVAARGYVDGRYIGEEKEVIEAIDPSGRGKRKRGKAGGKDGAADNRGNRIGGKGGKAGVRGAADGRGNRARASAGQARGPRGAGKKDTRGTPRVPGVPVDGNTMGAPVPGVGRGRDRDARRKGKARGGVAGAQPVFIDSSGPAAGAGNSLGDGRARPSRPRKTRGGKKTPFRAPSAGNAVAGSRLISEVAETRRWGDESKSGQFAEALAKEAHIKRERLHKVLAQSGHGSRRDMEIMISSGRVMVNGIVATTGTSVSPTDAVMIDHRLVKLKFSEELPRVLLYHKPEGEIVTTNDPGNRITVFDNLPHVENGKWMSVGRLDINTSGLLIFTTSGELANRLMHPRYEVEREYAVRILGELTDEQTQQLLSGVSITAEPDEESDEADELVENRPAKFDTIDKRGGEGVNQWYHVVLREGRNREVRKMFEAVGLTVSRLMRIRFGKIGLPPRLTRGRMLELDPSQARAVLRWVGMETEGPIGQLPTNGPARPVPVPRRGRAMDGVSDGAVAAGAGSAEIAGADKLENSRAQPAGEADASSPAERVRRGRGRRGRGKRDANILPANTIAPEGDTPAEVAVESAGLLREPGRGRKRSGRRGRGDRQSGSDIGLRSTGAAFDEDSIGNAITSVPREPVYDDIDDSIGNRIVSPTSAVIHRSSEARPPTGNPRRPEPHRRSRRRKGGSKPGPQGGGQGSAL
ncbi:MAG: pseudouridine synthase [Betaproteobacteria bacterium]|jgi:23S rRNA pseudouridine2605 synthase